MSYLINQDLPRLPIVSGKRIFTGLVSLCIKVNLTLCIVVLPDIVRFANLAASQRELHFGEIYSRRDG